MNIDQALKNPFAVLTFGPRPVEKRNSTKHVSGLMKVGAALMLGVACLSPIQNVSANVLAHQQTTYITAQEQVEKSVEQSIQERADNISIDEGLQKSIETGDMSFYNEAVSNYKMQIEKQMEEEANSYQVAQKELETQKLQEELVERFEHGERREEQSYFSSSFGEYERLSEHWVGDIGDATRSSIDFAGHKLIADAYQEIKAGHSAENPSLRLTEICEQADIIKASTGYEITDQGKQVFETCTSADMTQSVQQMPMKRSIHKIGGFIAVTATHLLGGSMMLGGAYLGINNISGAIQRRRKKKEQEQNHTISTNIPKLG